jgi:hypothetical protein
MRSTTDNALGHVLHTIPSPEGDIAVSKTRSNPPIPTDTRPRTIYYFTEAERQVITEAVFRNYRTYCPALKNQTFSHINLKSKQY